MADFMLRKLEDVAIRSYVIQKVLRKHENIDEEDAVTLLTLLVEIEEKCNEKQYSFFEDKPHPAFPAKPFKKPRNRLSFFLEDDNFNLEFYTAFECKGGPRRRQRLFRRKSKNKEKTGDDRGWGSWGQGKRNRISSIHLGYYAWRPWDFHTPHIQEVLAKLERLETLHLHHCVSGSLTNCLMVCPHVKHLWIYTDCFNDWFLKPEVTIGCPTILQEPPKNCKHNKNSDQHQQEFPFIHLESLVMWAPVDFDEGYLETFLFEILPCCPNLTRVEFERGTIKSFQRIAQKIREKQMLQTSSNLNGNDIHTTNGRLYTTFPSKIQTLMLGYYDQPSDYWYKDKDYQPKLAPLQNDPLELDAVKTILQCFPHLHSLSGAFGPLGSRVFSSSNHTNTPDNKDDHPCNWTEIDILAERNFAGRVLVEAHQDQDNLCHDSSPAIPLSVWPLVLERAWARLPRAPDYLQKHNGGIYWARHPLGSLQNGHDGIYYLLQNVPALLLETNARRRKETKSPKVSCC